MSAEERTLLLLLQLGGCLLVCLHFQQVFADICSRCSGNCNNIDSRCPLGCLSTWQGPYCLTNCIMARNCSDECGCLKKCICDHKNKTCNDSYCEEDSSSTSNKSYSLSSMGQSFIIALLSGAITLIVIVLMYFLYSLLRNYSKTRRLRGFLLSLPCFHLCPRFRDWLQRKGQKFGLKGLQLGVRDSLDSIGWDNENVTTDHTRTFRVWQREESKVIGVREEKLVTQSAMTGYRWKRKWRDRKAASKKKRKLKHEQRKLRRSGNQELRRESIILPSISIPAAARRGSTKWDSMFGRGASKQDGANDRSKFRPPPGELEDSTEQKPPPSPSALDAKDKPAPSLSPTPSPISSSSPSSVSSTSTDEDEDEDEEDEEEEEEDANDAGSTSKDQKKSLPAQSRTTRVPQPPNVGSHVVSPTPVAKLSKELNGQPSSPETAVVPVVPVITPEVIVTSPESSKEYLEFPESSRSSVVSSDSRSLTNLMFNSVKAVLSFKGSDTKY